MVGLDKVKNMLHDLVDLIELKNKTKDDLKIKNLNLHMVFLGNPGTGKTTVARIVAEMLYNLKYIKQNKMVLKHHFIIVRPIGLVLMVSWF